jgi:ubiquinone biosynthesis protein COQ9
LTFVTKLQLNWYTKRAALSAVYTSTELFMLSDNSPEFRETWKFLERRIDDAIKVNEFGIEVSFIGDFSGNTMAAVGQRLPWYCH